MNVISFPHWRVPFYTDPLDRNVIRHWLHEQGVTGPDRSALQALIDICEYSGIEALRSCTIDLGNGFFALSSRRKGSCELCPVFCHGPFSDSEITFLAGAMFEDDQLKPRYAAGIAEENLEALLKHPARRRREPVT